MMTIMDADGGTMMMQEENIPNSNNHLDEEEESGDDGASCSSTEGGSITNLKDRAAKETKRTLARKETRAGTLHYRRVIVVQAMIDYSM
jgi:hypothetical protein